MKKIATLLLAMVATATTYAQKIDVESSLGNPIFYENNEEISSDVVAYLMKDHTEAKSIFLQADKAHSRAESMIDLGILLVGYSTYTSISKSETTNWWYALGGLAIGSLSIPLHKKAYKKTKKAIDMYNSGQPSVSNQKHNTTLNLGASAQGLGLVLSF